MIGIVLGRVSYAISLFNEDGLKELFDTAMRASTNLSSDEMSELCLVPGLGAQISNGSSHDKTIMLYEN